MSRWSHRQDLRKMGIRGRDLARGKPMTDNKGNRAGKVVFCAVLGVFLVLLVAQCANAETYDAEAIVDAIWHVEGGEKAKKPFGILSVPCDGYEDCRQIALNTVQNNFSRYQDYGHKTHPDYISFLASRYCPVGAENDNGTNQFWLKNLRYVLAKGGR